MGIFNKARDFEKKIEAKKNRKEERERQKQGLETDENGHEDGGGAIDDDVEGALFESD
jgi:hypothetical protein